MTCEKHLSQYVLLHIGNSIFLVYVLWLVSSACRIGFTILTKNRGLHRIYSSTLVKIHLPRSIHALFGCFHKDMKT